MSNWCSNNLVIETDKTGAETFEKLRKMFTESDGIFNDLIPDTSDKDTWHEWRVKHWGTKWDIASEKVNVCSILEEYHYLEFEFLTAWSPPINVVDAILELPGVVTAKLSYYEPGMNFGGVYSADEDTVYDNIEAHLDDLDEDYAELFNLVPRSYNHDD